MKRRIIIIVLALVIIVGGGLGWYISSSPAVLERLGFTPSPSAQTIFASGFLEATDVAIAPEVSGRIAYIAVSEGDGVKAGVTVVKLDDSLLQAQQREAEAAVKLARAGLEQATVSREQAIVSRDGAKKVWEDALDIQSNPLELEARIIAAQGELEQVELILERAGREDRTWGKWDERTYEIRRETAEKVLQNLLDIKNNPQEINAVVDETHAAYQTAAKAVEVAAKAVKVAEGQVEQAEASLEVIKVQLSKLTLGSPISGIVAEQYAEVGEIAQPGVPVLTITELEEVTLTAYVPESKIGQVKLGQKTQVSVDSYPEESFTGEVVYISPRALFTPKNIQLREDREKTVFAVKIKLANPWGKLKPGMSADAEIIITGSLNQ